MQKRGYEIEIVQNQGNTVTGIKIDKDVVTMPANSNMNINVKLEGSTEGNEYYLKVEGKFYKIEKTAKGIEISRKESPIGGETGTENKLKVNIIEGNTITAEAEGNNIIKITSQDLVGETIIEIGYGEYKQRCTVKVEKRPTEDSIEVGEQGYSTEFGEIDVIWLDTNNNVKSNPNEPNLYTGLSSPLTPVTWTYNVTNKTWTEDEVAKTKWYEYKGKEKTDKSDNQESMWANAKNTVNGVDSYFVWIPRYAYRITYYEDEAKTKKTGYYDGYGMWNANTGDLNYKLDPGIEIVEYEGEKYIVHPAFIDDRGKTYVDKDTGETKPLEDFARGGWDKNQTGIWVAKYEMSRTDATSEYKGKSTIFQSIPGVISIPRVTIGDMYDYSLKYDNTKESHMMKNSEWGAIAYLTHSKYGRNAHEIDINNCIITGNGGGAVKGLVDSKEVVTNAYNTKIGAKASSTGNIYGIYDLSGCADEYMASYNKEGIENMENGGTMINNDKISTKYVTTYENTNDDGIPIAIVQKVSKIGDGIKEVKNRNTKERENYTWFGSIGRVPNKNIPFLICGGKNDDIYAGIFDTSYRARECYSGCTIIPSCTWGSVMKKANT